MPRVKLTVEYDGTHYVGWQLQPNGPSIQGRLQRALSQLFGEAVSCVAAGRTDSGVHAAGQVVAFDPPIVLPMRAYLIGLNGILPEDIAVVQATEVDDAFDPRRWAKGKRYIYRIINRRVRAPLQRHTHWEIFQPLDVGAMQAAAECLVGEHDYSAFRAADCEADHAVRRMWKAEVAGKSGEEITFTIEGTAFLKHMVRNLTGTLVDVGRKKHAPEWVKALLEGKDRTKSGATAPPHGLTLDEVLYDDPPRPRTLPAA